MRKLLAGLALATTLAFVPGFVSPAQAKDRGWHGGGYAGGYGGGNSAWDVVRSDPCRYDAFQRFAAKHQNPNKRARFAERLAREGCRERVAYDGGYDDDYPQPYGYAQPYGYGQSYGYAQPNGYAQSYGYGDSTVNVFVPLVGLLFGR